MIDHIISQIRSRFFDYKGSPRKLMLSNAEHLSSALNWFRGSLRSEGGAGAMFSLVSYIHSAGYPTGTAAWVPVLHRLKTQYPETYAELFGDADLAHELMNWVLLTQRRDGTFPSSYGDFMNQPPQVFSNGLIIHSLLDYYTRTGDKRLIDACRNSAEWLVKVQSPDGSWRQFTSNQLSSNTITGASLMRLGTLTGEAAIREAGERNIRFSLELQSNRGYFNSNGYDTGATAFTITLAYAIAGMLEAFLAGGVNEYRDSAVRGLAAVFEKVAPNGFLVGDTDSEYNSAASYSCLPGNSLLAVCGYKLASLTGNAAFKNTSDLLVNYVKEKQLRSGNSSVAGGITGSWPISGNYSSYEIPTMCVKYFVEAILLQDEANG